MVWKMDDAPADLRALYVGEGTPQWVAFVPASLYASDLDQTITELSGQTGLSKQPTKDGGVVYFGSFSPVGFLEILSKRQPSTGKSFS